ncbi:MAG: response regulator [Gemmatimonadetes bacterium]|nr:response regulator [Gemmatimonadota bacterium]NNM04393.1 response regulator [Gemmatimonadota bacterium]
MTSPTVLLIEDQEWTARSIETILRHAEFAVFKTYTGRQGLEVARKVDPDLVLVDRHLPDMSGGDVIKELKQLRSIGATTPIAIITGGPVTQAEKLDLLRVGAWEIFVSPFDPEELSLRVNTWANAKQEAARLEEESLVDSLTGAYNFDGLSRRVREIVAESRRYERPMACIVLGEPLPGENGDRNKPSENDVDRRVVDTLREVCRVSDAVGRVRDREFLVVAPSTDDSGAAVLVKRILEALDASVAEIPIRAGVFSLKRSPKEPLDITDLLGPATAALRRAQQGDDRVSFQSFQAN